MMALISISGSSYYKYLYLPKLMLKLLFNAFNYEFYPTFLLRNLKLLISNIKIYNINIKLSRLLRPDRIIKFLIETFNKSTISL